MSFQRVRGWGEGIKGPVWHGAEERRWIRMISPEGAWMVLTVTVGVLSAYTLI